MGFEPTISESLERVATSGGDLLDDLPDDLLTPYAGTLSTISFTIYKTGDLFSHWLDYISLVLSTERQHCTYSLKTITCESRPYLMR